MSIQKHIVLAALAAACGLQAAAQEPPPSADAGMKIQIDPATGKRIERPAPDPQARQGQAPAAALEQVPGTTRAGGVTVELKGQFHQSIGAHTGGDGKVHVDCEPENSQPGPIER